MGFDFENLIFDNESDFQSPITIFVIQEFDEGKSIEGRTDLTIYFPFDLNNDYLELSGKIEGKYIEFQPPNFDSKIKFEIDFTRKIFAKVWL
ncbi:hypothetical protein FEDK69T_30290 [Flavobacterium enshiense DK69]|nr:hypothetical protein FEDK69T_30290 [Flavobacterium enshiense DK69]